MSKRLFYIQDPMCSWCWGFRPVWLEVKAFAEAKNLPVTYINGGLAADSNDPMPEETREFVQANWRRIEEVIPATEFNYDFWTQCEPRRSTYPACRAVIAAAQLQPESEEAMIFAIQQAYYLRAQNPSDEQTLVDLAVGLGLDREAFRETLRSDSVQQQLVQGFQQYSKLATVTGVSGFPSLVLEFQHTLYALPRDYHHATVITDAIASLINND